MNISSGRDRLQGYKNALKNRKLPVREELIDITGTKKEQTVNVIINLLNNGPPFTAVVAHNDLRAFEILYALNKHKNFSHIEVVGFDNIEGKLMILPTFPSIDSIDSLAHISIELLIRRLKNRDAEPKQVILDVKLNNIKQP